jgi:hypothetical protein
MAVASRSGCLGGRFRPGLVCRDPRGGELKKSRRNRGAFHGDFHFYKADVFANYALHLDCNSSRLSTGS